MTIDWLSDETSILFNPRMPHHDQVQAQELIHALPPLKAHLWLGTSGSSGQIKWVALSKEALLNSAKAVNTHLQSTVHDIWLNSLPIFHVGGLGILARSFLSGASVVACQNQWNAKNFYESLLDSHATLTSLVPAQVYDLIHLQMQAPPKLRAVIVGGGALSESIHKRATALNWPLLPSYGLTECGSQVATSKGILDHLEVKIDDEQRICVKGSSLLTGYAVQTASGPQFIDPKCEGWFITEDLGSVANGLLHVHGRKGNFIKIGGESVDVLRLEKILEEVKMCLGISQDNILLAVEDVRLGHVIHLVTTQLDTQELVKGYNQKVMPFERIREVRVVSNIPRSPLNKVLKQRLFI